MMVTIILAARISTGFSHVTPLTRQGPKRKYLLAATIPLSALVGAWAFLISICAVFAIIEFFGAPKIRNALHINLWLTMILPGLNALAVMALVSLREQYVDRAPSAARAAA